MSSPQGLVVLVFPHFLPGPLQLGFPGGSVSKEYACNAEDPSLIPGAGRSPGKGNGNLLWCSCLGNPMDREAWWTTVHGVAKSRTQLNDQTTPTNHLRVMLIHGNKWGLVGLRPSLWL